MRTAFKSHVHVLAK